MLFFKRKPATRRPLWAQARQSVPAGQGYVPEEEGRDLEAVNPDIWTITWRGTVRVTSSKLFPILVVDDFPLVAATIAGLLKAEGFQNVEVAHGGSKALEKLERRDYRLVISDLKMPGVTGSISSTPFEQTGTVGNPVLSL